MKTFLGQLASRSYGIEGLSAPQTKLPRATLIAICVVIFLTALSVRLLYWQDNYADLLRGTRDSGLQKVSFFYYDQAQRILDDGGILFPRNPVDQGDATVLTHPPGYSILMAAVFNKFYQQGSEQVLLHWPEQRQIGSPGSRKSQADSALRIVQIIGEAASSVVIFLIAAELFTTGVALIAAMLCSFSPHFAYYSLMLGPDTLSILPLLLAVYLILRGLKRPRFLTMVTAGACVGLSCWLRANGLLLAPFLACIIPLLFPRGKRLRYSVALVAATVVTIAPIIVRNWIVFHRFVPLSVMAGLNLVEGIGDYDKENRFGMPSSDAESALKDAEWYGRPDYADNLWRPDGFERDKARFSRGLGVIRADPRWFLGVVLRRMEFMLRYNDSREDLYLLAMAPALSASPNFGHTLEPPAQMMPMWSSSSRELMTNGSVTSGLAQAAIPGDNQVLQITADGSDHGDMFSSEPIEVKKNTDYLLRVSMTLEQGNADAKIGTADPRIVLALVGASTAIKQPKRKAQDRDAKQPVSTFEPRMKVLLVPFASGNNTQVLPSFHKSTGERTVLNIGQAEMFEMGPTRYLWTQYPRGVVRGVQKNVFKTGVMRALIIVGILLFALARRGRLLAILLIVPLYYLVAQSPLHTEYRYVLAMHYFLFVIAGATIYYCGLVIGQSIQWGYQVAHGKHTRQVG